MSSSVIQLKPSGIHWQCHSSVLSSKLTCLTGTMSADHSSQCGGVSSSAEESSCLGSCSFWEAIENAWKAAEKEKLVVSTPDGRLQVRAVREGIHDCLLIRCVRLEPLDALEPLDISIKKHLEGAGNLDDCAGGGAIKKDSEELLPPDAKRSRRSRGSRPWQRRLVTVGCDLLLPPSPSAEPHDDIHDHEFWRVSKESHRRWAHQGHHRS